MINEILIQSRLSKKPLKTEGRFSEVCKIQLLLNGVILYEVSSDHYSMSKQSLVEMMLEKAMLLTKALEFTGNKVSVKHGSY